MARSSRWTKEDRKKLWKLVREGIAEQDIREQFATTDRKGNKRAMSAMEFAMQYKQASVEAGEIKQATRVKETEKVVGYQVTATGRLTITNFTEVTGAQGGETYALMRPRGRSNAWRLVPIQ
jgi:hypothetical protein